MTRTSTITRLRSYASPVALVAAGVTAFAALPPLSALADPEGGIIRGGAGSISQIGNTTNIQQDTDRLIVDWNSFDIDTDETVNFAQPGQSSIALNRVTGDAPTSISGALNANGNVWIVNQNGVTFNQGARVDVGGLLATTSDIDNGDFMDGNFTFAEPANPDARIINEGQITFGEAGLAALAAPGVENHGVIAGRLGTVVLEGTESFAVDLAGDGLLAFELDEGATSVINTGEIRNEGGRVLISAEAAGALLDNTISLGGLVEATSFAGQTGSIEVDGGTGITQVTGTVRASGDHGGDVSIQSAAIWLKDGSEVDVSGATGGGTALIGGTEIGGGPGPRAQHVLVSPDATISASATGANGDGGTIILWSDDSTRYYGALEATGGSAGGNGGFAEVSSFETLEFAGSVDLSAPFGELGTLLLDPREIQIVSNGDINENSDEHPVIIFDFDPDPDNGGGQGGGENGGGEGGQGGGEDGDDDDDNEGVALISASFIENAGANAHVILQARENILVLTEVNQTVAANLDQNDVDEFNREVDVTFLAGNQIQIFADFATTGDLSFFADDGIVVQSGETLTAGRVLNLDGSFSLNGTSTLTLDADANLAQLNTSLGQPIPAEPQDSPFQLTDADGVGLLDVNGTLIAPNVVLVSGASAANTVGTTTLDLDNITATNSLTVTHTGGEIEDLNVGTINAGDANVTITAQGADDTLFDITLNNSSHDFGTITATGADVLIDDTNDLTIVGGTSNQLTLDVDDNIVFGGAFQTGSLVANAGDSILDNASGAVSVTGDASLVANDDILLNDDASTHNFGGRLDLIATGNGNNDVAIRDNAGGLQLGEVSADSLHVISLDEITDTDADPDAGTEAASIVVSGAASVTAENDPTLFNITLDNDEHDFGTLDVRGAIMTINDTNDLGIGGSGNQLNVGADGTLTFGSVDVGGLDASGGAITDGGAGAVTVGGTGSLTSGGNITMDNAGAHDFNVLNLDGGAVVQAESNAVTFGTVDVASLDFSAEGIIDDGGAGTITVSGAATIDATDGTDTFDIELDNSGAHDFQGTLSFLGNTVTVVDLNALSIDNSQATTSASLTAEAGELTLATVTVDEAPGGFLLGIGTSVVATDILAETIVLGGAGSTSAAAAAADGDLSIERFDTVNLRMNSSLANPDNQVSVTDGRVADPDANLPGTIEISAPSQLFAGFATDADFSPPENLRRLTLDRAAFDGGLTVTADDIRLGFITVGLEGAPADLNLTAENGNIAKRPDAELDFEVARAGNVTVAHARDEDGSLGVLVPLHAPFEDLLNVAGNANLIAGFTDADNPNGFGNVVLTRAIDGAEEFGVDFQGAVSIEAVNAAIEDTNALQLASIDIEENLAIRFNQTGAGGDLTQDTSGITVGEIASFISGDVGDTRTNVTLNQAVGNVSVNDFQNLDVIAGTAVFGDTDGFTVLGGSLSDRLDIGSEASPQSGDVTLNDLLIGTGLSAFVDGNLNLDRIEVATGNLVADAGGSIFASNLIVSGGTADFDAGTDLTLFSFQTLGLDFTAGSSANVSNGQATAQITVVIPLATLELNNLHFGDADASFTTNGTLNAQRITAGDLTLISDGEMRLGLLDVSGDLVARSNNADVAFLTPLSSGSQTAIEVAGVTSRTIGLDVGTLIDDLDGVTGEVRVVQFSPGTGGFSENQPPQFDEMLEVTGTTSVSGQTGIDFSQANRGEDLNTILNGATTLIANTGDVIVEADSALGLALVRVLDPNPSQDENNSRGNLTLRTNTTGDADNGTQTITQSGAISVTGSTTLITGTAAIGDDVTGSDELADIILANVDNRLESGGDSFENDAGDFTGTISVIGDRVELTNFVNISMSASHVEDELHLNAIAPPAGVTVDDSLTGDIVQDDIRVAGLSSLSATGSIDGDDLELGGNDVDDTLALHAVANSADEARGDIDLNTVTVTGQTSLSASGSIIGDTLLLGSAALQAQLAFDAVATGPSLGEGEIDLDNLTVTGNTSLDATGTIDILNLALHDIDARADDNVFLASGGTDTTNLTAGNAVGMTGIGAGTTTATAEAGNIEINNSTITGGFDALAENADILLTTSSLDGPLLMQALQGSITQTDGDITVQGDTIIRAGTDVDLSTGVNDFNGRFALLTGGDAHVVNLDGLSFGVLNATTVRQADPLVPTTLGAIVEDLLGAPQVSALAEPATSGFVGGAWAITSEQGVTFDGALDGAGSILITTNHPDALLDPFNDPIANPVDDTGASVRIGDLIGATVRLDEVEIRNANGVAIGVATSAAALAPVDNGAADGTAFLDQDPQRDVLFATNLRFKDNVGTIETVRSPETNLIAFELTLQYYGVDLAGNLFHDGNAADYDLDITGAIGSLGIADNARRSRAVGLLPQGGPTGGDFKFNNCVIGNISSCSAEVPTLALPQIDLSLPNIFEIDFEALGDVYVNFGNEELWTIPTLFEDDEESASQGG